MPGQANFITTWMRAVVLLVALALAGCSALPTPVSTAPTRKPAAATVRPVATAKPSARPTARPAARATPKPATTSTPRPAATAAPTPKPAATPKPAVARIAGFDAVTPGQLPPEARHTLALIAQGGPFPYRQDGAVFQNRERRLPRKPSGHYHEYTVETPGSDDRGARRIIAGDAGELFYTADHYDTFVQVVPE